MGDGERYGEGEEKEREGRPREMGSKGNSYLGDRCCKQCQPGIRRRYPLQSARGETETETERENPSVRHRLVGRSALGMKIT